MIYDKKMKTFRCKTYIQHRRMCDVPPQRGSGLTTKSSHDTEEKDLIVSLQSGEDGSITDANKIACE